MVSTLTIVVQSAVLFLSGAVNEPVPFCVVQYSTSQQQQFYENPEGGCNALGASLKVATERQYPSTPVVLIVDGKNNQEL